MGTPAPPCCEGGMIHLLQEHFLNAQFCNSRVEISLKFVCRTVPLQGENETYVLTGCVVPWEHSNITALRSMRHGLASRGHHPPSDTEALPPPPKKSPAAILLCKQGRSPPPSVVLPPLSSLTLPGGRRLFTLIRLPGRLKIGETTHQSPPRPVPWSHHAAYCHTNDVTCH